MRGNSLLTICALVGVVATLGCAPVTPVTPNSLRAGKGSGVARVYPAPLTTVWDAVLTVLSDLKLKCIEESKQGGYLLAESELAIIGKGELVIVFVETQEETRSTHVEVIAKKVNPSGPFGPAERNWALDILHRLDINLKHPSSH
jgi:hypothetical protein